MRRRVNASRGIRLRRRGGARGRHDATLQTYFATLAPIPLLSAEEEHELAVELARLRDDMSRGADPSAERRYQQARNRFMRANLRLVISIAARYQGSSLPLADLVQEGNLGLMTAVDRFDPDKGVRFSTYASWWIRHGVTRALANHGRTVRLPCYVATTNAKLNEAAGRLQATLARPPTTDELAEETGMPAQRIERTRLAMCGHAVSLDADGASDDARPLLDRVTTSTPPPSDAIDGRVVRDALGHAMRELTPMEQDIITRRFGLEDDTEQTLQRIGDEHRLSRERIRQVQNRALRKMRGHLERQGVGL